MRRRYPVILLSFFLIGSLIMFSGCVEKSEVSTSQEHINYINSSKIQNFGNNSVEFAKMFKLYPHWNRGYCIVIYSEGNIFVLVEKNATVSVNISNAKVIKVPVKKIVTDFYCPIISTADILNAYHNTIVGAPKYAIEESPKLEKLYKEGKVVNIGSPGNINYEIVANLSPDIVFLSSWKSEDKVEEKLKELGITVSRFYTYKEPTYMGRVEWVKFAAAFWGSSAYNKANKWFNKVVSVRAAILRKVKNVSKEPTVVIFSWSKMENMPAIYGNDSYYSKMITEFKGRNIFGNYSGGYQTINKETFLEKAKNADVVIMIWYYGSNITTKKDLLKICPEFADFKAFKTGRFYVSHPDYYVWEARDPAGYMIDFAKMIHPKVFGGDNNLKYFYKINS